MKREANNLAELAEHAYDDHGKAKFGTECEGKELLRARIAACAPEALRMLESLEWDAEGMCPVCSKTTDREHTHRDDCPWLALMRKAGLR